MKTNKFFMAAIVAAFVAFSFVSCKSPVDADSLTVTPTEVIVFEGMSVTVKAELKDKDGSIVNDKITWESKNTAVATVVDGKIRGIKEGETQVVASYGSLTPVFVNVTVKYVPDPVDHPSLMGSNYYVFFISDAARAMIADRIIADFTPNGEIGTEPDAKRLWIWEETYAGLSTVGQNSYGLGEGWMKFEMVKDWAGAGYCIYDIALVKSMKAISDNINDYYLHIAYKSSQPGRNTIFQLPYGAPDPQPYVVIGEGTNGKAAYTQCTTGMGEDIVETTFSANGEWYHFDIPMTYFASQNLIYRDNFAFGENEGRNVFVVLSNENPTGTIAEYDAAFIYKKTQ